MTALLASQVTTWQSDCHRQPQSAGHEIPPAVQVRVQTVEDVVGTVRAKLHAALEAKVSGRIEKMLVTPG